MTGTQVLQTVLSLMAEDQANISNYTTDALNLINLMMPELFALNNNILVASGSAELTTIPSISALSETIPMDDRIAREILPFGLAAKLVFDDSPTKAIYFNNEFIEKKNSLAVTSIQPITDVYSDEEDGE